MKKIQVLYFASLREEARLSQETIFTEAQTVQDLWSELKEKYHFTLRDELIRVAINEEYAPFTSSFESQDTLVFIPPVAGG
jgi:molybdopterin converting factor subunit 1